MALFLQPKTVKQRKHECANVSFCDPVQSMGFSKQTIKQAYMNGAGRISKRSIRPRGINSEQILISHTIIRISLIQYPVSYPFKVLSSSGIYWQVPRNPSLASPVKCEVYLTRVRGEHHKVFDEFTLEASNAPLGAVYWNRYLLLHHLTLHPARPSFYY